MGGSAVTLTEFLLARFDEDERRWGNPAFAPVAGWGLSELVRKMRADFESKRRIVEYHAESVGGTCDICEEYGPPGPCQTQRWLALPYAEHPDYREEWKP